MILNIGNPILHQKAQLVTNFGSDELRQLVDRMFAIMREKDGVGLAAPQIGISLQVFVYGFEYCPRYPDAPAVPVMAVINPEIIWQSEETSDYAEGCLSVPFKRGMITRSNVIKFTYYDLHGEKHEKSAQGFEARIVQHETDHINGILIADRAKELHESKIA